MSDIEKYKDTELNSAMKAIKSIADGQYEMAMGHLSTAIRAESAKNVLILQELCEAVDESESNV